MLTFNRLASLFIPAHRVKVESLVIFYTATLTTKKDAWSSAQFGLIQVSLVKPLPDSLSSHTRHPCSRTEDVHLQPKPLPVHRPH
jgi:hypothetical protein